jgi:translation initiation factor 2 subunit 2
MSKYNNYSTSFLIDKFYNEYSEKNKNQKKARVPPPAITTENRKTFITNFTEICESIDRKQIDVSSYIAAELEIQTSISATGVLIIHSTYKRKRIEDLITKYIINYVQCPTCKRWNSTITKVAKLNYIECKMCLAKTAI